jgi:hypothetical protein
MAFLLLNINFWEIENENTHKRKERGSFCIDPADHNVSSAQTQNRQKNRNKRYKKEAFVIWSDQVFHAGSPDI